MRFRQCVSRLGLAALAVASVLSCGEQPRFAAGRIRGVVWLSGPVAGARVCVYQADESGGRASTPLGDCVETAADGSFDAGVGVGLDTLVVEVAGPASYVELATGESVTLDPRVVLTAAVTRFEPDEARESVVVSPLTSMAVSLAGARLTLGKEATYTAAVERADALVGAHFGGVAAGRTAPADPTLGPVTSVTEDVRYGLVLAGLSHLAWSIRQESALTVNGANTALLAERLASDLASAEALFDGQGAAGPLSLGLCPCAGEPCDTLCTFDSRTPRTDLAGESGIVGFLGGSRNPTGLRYEDVATVLVEPIATNTEPELFPPGDPGPVDTTAPTVRFLSPGEGFVLDGMVTIEVEADDATRVTSLLVTVGGQPAPPDADTALLEHYLGQLDTTGFPDGPITLAATAADAAGNARTESITVTINNHGPGTLGGTCVKGPLRDAVARAYRYAGGEKGAAIGADGATDADGNFTITGIEGYAGPLLVECGGATAHYEEEAFVASITLSSGDHLRTVVPQYEDGENRNGVIATPWTSIATAYLEWSIAGATPVPAAELEASWHAASGLISGHLAVVDVASVAPVPLTSSVTTYADGARYAFALAGLSQLAVRFAGEGGATLGAAVNAASLWKALERDVTDGCLDGRDAGGAITVVGVPLTSDTARYELAEAIVAFMTGEHNPTALDYPPDAIDFLDHLSAAGPSDPGDDPLACGSGELFPDAGALYDRVPPDIVWDSPTPAADSLVRQTIEVRAHAVDAITASPSLVLTDPPGVVSLDPPGSTVRALIDTTACADGPLVIGAQATDGAGRSTGSSFSVTVDNTAPVITVTGVADGAIYDGPVTPVITTSDGSPVTVIMNGGAFASGSPVTVDGHYQLQATATDAAGNAAVPVLLSFTIDQTWPLVSIISPAPGGYSGAFTLEAVVTGEANLTSFTVSSHPALDAQDVELPLDRIRVPIAQGTFPDGALVLAVTATDLAGHVTTESVAVTLDTLAPEVNVTSPAYGTWFGVGQQATIAGTTGDATSGVQDVEVQLGSTIHHVTPISSTWSFSFVPTTSGTCGTSTWTGDNPILVRARDAAGNVSTPDVEWLVRRDDCPARVQVTSAEMHDERTYRAAFTAAGLRPCLYSVTGGSTVPASTFAIDAELPLGPVPPVVPVHKYAINTGSWGTGDPRTYCPSSSWALPPDAGWTLDTTGNPVVFDVAPTDLGSGVAQVRYQIRPPGGAFGAEQVAPVVVGTTRRITIDHTNAPALASNDGGAGAVAWEVRVIVEDVAGTDWVMEHPIQFSHHALAGPFHVEPQPLAGATDVPSGSGYLIPGATLYGLGAGQTINALYSVAGNKVAVKKYRIWNGTPTVSMVAVDPGAISASWSRTILDHNVLDGSDCWSWPPACALGGSNPAFSPPTEAGSCLASVPTNATLPGSGTDATFIKQVTAYSSSGAAVACSGSTCAPYEWQIPAASGGTAGYIDVYLLTSKLAFLWDATLGAPADISFAEHQLPGTTTWSLFGRAVYDWGSNYVSCGDGETHIQKHRRVQYLQSASVAANNPADQTAFSTQLTTATGRYGGLAAMGPKDAQFSFSASESPSGP